MYRACIVPFDMGDAVGSSLRRSGGEIVDTMTIQGSSYCLYAYLVRNRGPHDTTVRESVLDGTDALLDIDSGRISNRGMESHDTAGPNHFRHGGCVYGEGKEGKNQKQVSRDGNPRYNSDGRWPTNTILVHGEACEIKGQTHVGSGPESGYTDQSESYDVNGFVSSCQPDSPSNYGEEEINDWDCQDGCPVEQLNGQSGIRPGASSGSEVEPANNYRPGQNGNPQGEIYDDIGGASRFYYQAESLREVIQYIGTLVGDITCIMSS